MPGEIPETLEVEQLWAIEAEFARDGGERRSRVRRAHLEDYERLVREGVILVGGALGDVESALILLRAGTEEEALRLAHADAYWTSGAWSSVRVRPFAAIRVKPGA